MISASTVPAAVIPLNDRARLLQALQQHHQQQLHNEHRSPATPMAPSDFVLQQHQQLLSILNSLNTSANASQIPHFPPKVAAGGATYNNNNHGGTRGVRLGEQNSTEIRIR